MTWDLYKFAVDLTVPLFDGFCSNQTDSPPENLLVQGYLVSPESLRKDRVKVHATLHLFLVLSSEILSDIVSYKTLEVNLRF